MPELPEVELVTNALRELIVSRRIAVAELRRERLAPDHAPAEFAERIGRSAIVSVRRRGKHILIDLDNGRTLIVHLRMSGRFLLLGPDRDDPKFAHAVFHFDDDTRLVFQDQRHFGFMRIVDTESAMEAKELAKLAPEPFADEFDADYLYTTLRRTNRPLKLVLLDQTRVLGLGNIYASEALFLSGINPRRRASAVSRARVNRLFGSIRDVLAESMSHGSSAKIDPENIDGSYFDGGNESTWRVYDREGDECVDCRTPIRRIVQGGRSTYFCPNCQR